MADWTLSQARRDFGIGFLTGFVLQVSEDRSSWRVALLGGTARGYLVDARSKEVRSFKSLDAAVRAIQEIGFGVESLVVGSYESYLS